MLPLPFYKRHFHRSLFLILILMGSHLQAQAVKLEGILYSQDSVPQVDFKIQLFAQSYLLSESKTDNSGKFSLTNLTISNCRIVVHKLGIRKEFLFAWESVPPDSSIFLDLYLNQRDTSLLHYVGVINPLAQNEWYPYGTHLYEKDDFNPFRFVQPDQNLNDDPYSDIALIWARAPYPDGYYIRDYLHTEEYRHPIEQRNNYSQIIPTPDQSETNPLGIRNRPPIIKPYGSATLNLDKEVELSYEEEDTELWYNIVPLLAPPTIENDPVMVQTQANSSFGLNVGSSNYLSLKVGLQNNHLLPPHQIRIEELINSFEYSIPTAIDNNLIGIETELSPCPWDTLKHLARFSIQTQDIPASPLPSANLVFLIDVSTSITNSKDFLILRTALEKVAHCLRPNDQMAIILYGGYSEILIPTTKGTDKVKIKAALKSLHFPITLEGPGKLSLAYRLAREAFIKDANNQVILCTDNNFDFDHKLELSEYITSQEEQGIKLSTVRLGYYKSSIKKMAQMAELGGGISAHVSNHQEAEQVFVNRLLGSTYSVAREAKVRVNFNSAAINSYRLIGYEDKVLYKQDSLKLKNSSFDIGHSSCITAVYEIVLNPNLSLFSPQSTKNSELLNVQLGYIDPQSGQEKSLQKTLFSEDIFIESTSKDQLWIASVAECAMLLRNSDYLIQSDWPSAIERAEKAAYDDTGKLEFVRIMRKAHTQHISQ